MERKYEVYSVQKFRVIVVRNAHTRFTHYQIENKITILIWHKIPI